jgi:hypothetical protein
LFVVSERTLLLSRENFRERMNEEDEGVRIGDDEDDDRRPLIGGFEGGGDYVEEDQPPPPSADERDDENTRGERLPKWFSPKRLLYLFCLVAIALYLDRGVVSSAAVSGQPPGGSDEDDASKDEKGYGLQGEFNVDYAEYGVLQSVFVIGLLVGAPIFSELSRSVNAFTLIAIGLRVESKFSVLVAHANHRWRWRGKFCSSSGTFYRRPRSKRDDNEMVELFILVRAVWCGVRYRVRRHRRDVFWMAFCIFW